MFKVKNKKKQNDAAFAILILIKELDKGTSSMMELFAKIAAKIRELFRENITL